MQIPGKSFLLPILLTWGKNKNIDIPGSILHSISAYAIMPIGKVKSVFIRAQMKTPGMAVRGFSYWLVVIVVTI